MVTKFNFGTEQSSVPDGYTLDFGEAYSQSQGYGWVEESDLTTPLDITPNGRDRDLEDDQLIDTLLHMQYPEEIDNPDAVKTPAAWLYDIENGQYLVTVGVGDSAYNDSVYNINVEDVNLISNLSPSVGSAFATATTTVNVTDGQLTVDAIGGTNTKLNFIEIETISITDTKINFGLSDSPAPEDYIKDFGQAYSDDAGYGWITEASVGNADATPLDVTPNARDRDLVDNDLNDTLLHMQYPEEIDNPDAVTTPAAWEYAVPNGDYRVTVRVGDAAFTDSTHVINVEGNNAIDNFTPTDGNLFETTTTVVTVTDGKLTVDAIGGENTKLNYVRISPTTDVKINFGPEDFVAIPEDYYRDYGQAYSDTRGYGWITQDSVGSGNSTPVDITGNTRVRNLAEDPISDSLIHMQYPEELDNPTANNTPAAWEYAIPDGQYEVKVGVGDIAFTDSIHTINIEGVEVISDFEPNSGALFTTATATVEVNDGNLTLDAIGGENTKLNFIEISSVDG